MLHQGGEAGPIRLPVGWQGFVRLCQQLGFGELERVKVQDGVPVFVEVVKKKVKVASK